MERESVSKLTELSPTMANTRVVPKPPEPNNRASQPADVWAAGAMLGFLLAGTVPPRMLVPTIAAPKRRSTLSRQPASHLFGRARVCPGRPARPLREGACRLAGRSGAGCRGLRHRASSLRNLCRSKEMIDPVQAACISSLWSCVVFAQSPLF